MSPDGTSSQAGWHSIRPWMPLLSLTVREITSVSVTFILSSSLSDPSSDLEPLAALGLIGAADEGDQEGTHDVDGPQALELKKKSIIADALAKGLSVDVNSSAWQRVFIRIEEGTDEAVIIIYGLMPGREYDVKLSLAQSDNNGSIHQQVKTEEVELEPTETPTDPESPDGDRSTSSDPPASTPSTSVPTTPPPTTAPFSFEDRLAQLQHTLTLTNAERETLTTTLKTSRRDAQKADAALRSEIEILKRASEKHVVADHRAKQKILSLQEAVKRAQITTRETEELVKEVEELVPELNQQRHEKESDYAKVKEQADRVQRERNRQAEREKKKLDSMRNELAGLTSKMEKLNAKKEKLENSTITDLEEQLENVKQEIEQEEMDAQVYTYAPFNGQQELSTDDLDYHGTDPMISERSPAFPYLPVQRMRVQLPSTPGLINRPAPIQRPSPSEPTHNSQALPQWNHAPRQRQTSLTHVPRSSLQYQQTPILLQNPNRQNSHSKVLNSSTSATISPPVPTLNSPTNVINHNHNNVSSMLSSRAPAFEPGRAVNNNTMSIGTSSGFSVTPSPIQRPHSNSLRGLGLGLQSKSKTNSQQLPWAGIRNS